MSGMGQRNDEAAAPLIATTDAPVPAGGDAAWVHGAGDLRLRAALFPATTERPRGSVIVSPGRAEPLEKYFEVVEDLRARGFAVLAHDWRGQGLSARLLPDRLKGHAQGFEDFLTDYDALLDAYADRLPRPWIALGHSLGGCLSLMMLARDAALGERSRLAGAVLSAPMLGLRFASIPPAAVAALVGVFSRLRPTASPAGQASDPVQETFPDHALTQDEARFRRYHAQLRACPDLRLGPVTWGWLGMALGTAAWLRLRGRLEAVQAPVVAVLAGADRLVDNDAARATLARLPHGRVVEVEGAWHEVLIETDDKRVQFWTAFDGLAGRVAPAI